MDTSETYVKMSFFSQEVQDDSAGFALSDDKQFWTEITIGNQTYPVWLPRQDQLQEMVRGKMNVQSMIYRLHNNLALCSVNYLKLIDTDSMEQLWLAFVMSERYSKIWNGEDWVKFGNPEKSK